MFAGPWDDAPEVKTRQGLRYELMRVVNRGGMGEIALGKVRGTKGFEKIVVLKRLRADAEREDHIEMFDVEQEVMSRIEHPNIVKVFDQPVIEGVPYMAMEYIRGRNLDQIVRGAHQGGQELTLQFSLSVLLEVLRGLAFVHRLKDGSGNALGVVHQDMTPSNVMVSFYGEVKITDFGISYVTSRDGGLRKGVLKGKPRYVAPEVLAGKRVNNTADIYGVGVVLYELLTGQALFARSTVKETLSAVARNELPDFEKDVGEHGPGIVAILDKALKKDPMERYRTAEGMAADVLNELSRLGGTLPPANVAHVLRVLFKGDSDVPEMDPALEEAIQRGLEPPVLKAADLDETINELNRLLGEDDSVDLFSVPPEIQADLSDMNDMDPFQAKTPLPSFMWDAKDDEERLRAANEAYKDDFAGSPDVLPGAFLTKKDDVVPFEAPPVPMSEPRPSDTAPLAEPAAPEASAAPEAAPFTPAAREGPLVVKEVVREAPAPAPAPRGGAMGFIGGLLLGLAAGAAAVFFLLK